MIENEEAVLRPAPVPQMITKIENATELTAVQMKALCMKKCKTSGRDVTLRLTCDQAFDRERERARENETFHFLSLSLSLDRRPDRR